MLPPVFTNEKMRSHEVKLVAPDNETIKCHCGIRTQESTCETKAHAFPTAPKKFTSITLIINRQKELNTHHV